MDNQEKQQAISELKALVEPTMKVYTVVKHVSSSGMSRHISCYIMVKEDKTGESKIRNIDWYLEKICGYKRAKNRDALVVSGCGMDMGFSVVYHLSSSLYPEGFKCLGEICRANDHTNDYTCKRIKGKHHHRDGGYALKQEWL